MVLEKDPTRHPLDGFFDRLGETTLLDLFDRYRIEEKARLGLLAATVAQVIDREDPTDDFVDRVLLVLEVNCRAYSDSLSFREQRARSVERSPG